MLKDVGMAVPKIGETARQEIMACNNNTMCNLSLYIFLVRGIIVARGREAIKMYAV